MQSPVVISCVDHVSVTALLHDKQNGIRAASAPETAPAGSRLVQSAAVVGSRSQAHAVVWQVDQATAVAVKEVHGTLVATVSETVSAQGRIRCLLGLVAFHHLMPNWAIWLVAKSGEPGRSCRPRPAGSAPIPMLWEAPKHRQGCRCRTPTSQGSAWHRCRRGAKARRTPST
jgi:hypothetical protein